MNKIFFLVALLAIAFQKQALALQKPELIKINENYRLKQSPNEFQTFRLAKNDLQPNKQYNIKVSYIGSIGLQMKVYWKSYDTNIKVAQEFKPLDTERLHFYTDEKGDIRNISSESIDEKNQEYQFTLVGYRNTRSRDLETKNQQFEYILKIEEVIFDNVPSYIVQQLIICVVATLILAFIISVSYFKKNGFINQLFSNQTEDKKEK